MKTKIERVREMHKAGFSPSVISSNLRQQGHDIDLHQVNVILNYNNKPYVPNNKPKFHYKVNTKMYTSRTTEEMKNKYHVLCELLNNGSGTKEIAEKLSCSTQYVHHMKHRYLLKKWVN